MEEKPLTEALEAYGSESLGTGEWDIIVWGVTGDGPISRGLSKLRQGFWDWI